MRKLHNAAYDIFINTRHVEYSQDYSKFEDIVYHINQLGEYLLLERSSSGTRTSMGSVISALTRLADHMDIDMEDILAEALETYRKKESKSEGEN